MKIITICFVLLYQNQHIQCASSPNVFSNLPDMISNTFRGIVEDIYHLLVPQHPRLCKEKRIAVKTHRRRNQDNKYVNDFISNIENTTDIDPHVAEYHAMDFEPTALMNVNDKVKLHGNLIEVHKVKTADGYILTVHRVMLKQTSIPKNRTVLLHHGLLGSSADWVMLGPDKSLPYLLSDAGYDVWMTNARGNHYSRAHATLDNESPRYWNFTWQEMGTFDLPAVLDYIHEKKNNSMTIDYIGHSMGATALLVLLATEPIYQTQLRMAIFLAPLGLMNAVRGPLRALASISMNPPDVLLDILGRGDFLPKNRVPTVFIRKYCKISTLFCSNPRFFICGSMKTVMKNPDKGFLARLLYHAPAGGSTHTIMHYAQILKSGKLHAFNDIQTEFNIKHIIVPIALFSSNDDMLAPVADVMKLYVTIKNPVDHVIIRNMNITHTEFVWGTDAHKVVFKKILKLLHSDVEQVTKTNEVI